MLPFTQQLEPAFSNVTMTNEAGQRASMLAMRKYRRERRPSFGSDCGRCLRAHTRSAGASCRSIRTPPQGASSSRSRGEGSGGGDAVDTALVIARLIHFGMAMAAFGATAFGFMQSIR